jgi:hypothetical protein
MSYNAEVGLAASTYTIEVKIDGAGSWTPVNIVCAGVSDTWENLIDSLNGNLSGATAYISNYGLYIKSNTIGASSTIQVQDGTSTPFIAAVNGISTAWLITIETPVDGINATYTATLEIDDAGNAVVIDVVGSSAFNFKGYVDEIQADIDAIEGTYPEFVDVTVSLESAVGENSYVKIESGTTGSASVADFQDTDLASELTDYDSISNKNYGTDPTSDPNDPLKNFGVLNPTNLDDRGYVIRIVYQTQSNEPDPDEYNYPNDIRIPEFSIITDIVEEDIFYDLEYGEEA